MQRLWTYKFRTERFRQVKEPLVLLHHHFASLHQMFDFFNIVTATHEETVQHKQKIMQSRSKKARNSPYTIPSQTFVTQDEKEKMCASCSLVFSSHDEYDIHMQVIHMKPVFACKNCGLAFPTKENMITHSLVHQNVVKEEITISEADVKPIVY